MKKLALMSCCALTASITTLLAGDPESVIEVGDTRAFVVEMLGEPEGSVGSGHYEMLDFERGTVELVNGKVTATDLLSEEKAAELKAERQKAEEEQKKAAEAKAREQAWLAQQAEKQKPTPAPGKAEVAQSKFTPEQQAELDRRIAEGIDEPPYRMSKRTLRRYRRGRSESETALRKEQITEAYMAELKAAEKK